MSINHSIKVASGLSPGAAAAKGLRHAGRLVAGLRRQAVDTRRCTYSPRPDLGGGGLDQRLAPLEPEGLAGGAETISAFSVHAQAHRFDLLGSGWVTLAHGMTCRGFGGHVYPPPPGGDDDLIKRLNPGNRDRARSIRAMIGSGYTPIDWQLDFRSGFRWSEGRASGALRYGHVPGADVKVPWELARLQHLPVLGLAFVLARAGVDGFAWSDRYMTAFRDQALDFLAANPPGFGVNWIAPMEATIRISNLLLALDLFHSDGAGFDGAFKAEVQAAAVDHGRFIAQHMDWHPEHRGNHYMAEVCGLAFCAAYLPRSPETDAWLALGVRELITETARQFLPDGGHFEASTGYHRLVAEMVTYTTALVLGLPEERLAALETYDFAAWRGRPALAPAPVEMASVPGGDGVSPFPTEHFERIARMAAFTAALTKPGGRVAQIGDADSGRWFKPAPPCQRMVAAAARRRYANLAGYSDLADDIEYWDEDTLDHRPLVDTIGALFGNTPESADGTLLQALANGRHVAQPKHERPAYRVEVTAKPPAGGRGTVIELAEEAILDGLEAVAFPDFGVYVWRGPRLFLAVRCGAFGRDGRGAHAHNDQLAIELAIDGTDWLADPGSYVYTADLEARNAYRSVAAHAAPRSGDAEPGRLDHGPFDLIDAAGAQCLRFDEQGFLGTHTGFGEPVTREITLQERRIVIRDIGGDARPGRVLTPNPTSLRGIVGGSVPFSPGYDKVLAEGQD